jgi:hypothetical protein
VRILLRADSGFAREEQMAWCEANGVYFLFGLARTDRLIAEIKAELEQAAAQSRRTGKPARRFKDFRWRTRTSWSRARRVVAKAQWTKEEANPRSVVTSLKRAACKARYLYEKVYCATRRHGDAHLRRIGLQHTPYAKATCGNRPPQAAQDRRPRARECPPPQSRDGVSVSGGRCLGLRCPASRRCSKHPRFARLTRAAATRNHAASLQVRRDHVFAAAAARKSPSNSRVSRRHRAARLQKGKQTVAQTCSIMQR